MTHSMTGFATRTGQQDGWSWTWENRTVNGRGLDAAVIGELGSWLRHELTVHAHETGFDGIARSTAARKVAELGQEPVESGFHRHRGQSVLSSLSISALPCNRNPDGAPAMSTRTLSRSLALAAALVLSGPLAIAGAPKSSTGTAIPAPISKELAIIGVNGDVVGTLTLTQGPTGVLMRIEIGDGTLEEGWHGLHLHAVGDCSDVGEFKKSGSHVGMEAGGHGLLNPAGPEAGDLPNIYATYDGSANAEVFTTFVSLAQGDSALMDADGSALIVHAFPDDHFSQPIGGAGPRVACAVIR